MDIYIYIYKCAYKLLWIIMDDVLDPPKKTIILNVHSKKDSALRWSKMTIGNFL